MVAETSSSALAPRAVRLRIGLVLIAAIVLIALVLLHVPHINGGAYWQWRWRRIAPARLYPLMLLAGAPLLLGQWLAGRARRLTRWTVIGVLALAMISNVALQLIAATVRSDRTSLEPLMLAVQSPMVTSYFTDAARLVTGGTSASDWLRRYPELMQGMVLHSQEKPPGPVLFHAALIARYGLTNTASLLAGVAIAVMTTLAVPSTYLFLRSLVVERRAALPGALFVALAPGIVLFLPLFDGFYAALACAFLGTWVLALRRASPASAIACGAVLALMSFFAYNMLVLGTWIIGYAAIDLLRRETESRGRALSRVVLYAAIVLATTAALYAALYFVSGFNPLATLQAALENQRRLSAEWNRPYPQTLPFDLLDFALGAGWIALLPVVFLLLDARGSSEGEPRQRHRLLVLLGLAQVAIVALTGLLQGETARVWAFMLPLLALPVGLELARWPAWARGAFFAAMLVVLATLCQNMTFIDVEGHRAGGPLVAAGGATYVEPHDLDGRARDCCPGDCRPGDLAASLFPVEGHCGRGDDAGDGGPRHRARSGDQRTVVLDVELAPPQRPAAVSGHAAGGDPLRAVAACVLSMEESRRCPRDAGGGGPGAGTGLDQRAAAIRAVAHHRDRPELDQHQLLHRRQGAL